MRRLIMRINMYFKGKEMWNAKMSEHLKITITSMPQKEEEAEIFETKY